jgi:hypothetical protein
MGTARVSAVRFLFTSLKTLTASPTGGPPTATSVNPATMIGTTFGRGRHLVLEKSTRRTGPTYIHNKYIFFRYSGTHKNDIYKKKLKIK